MRNPRADLYLLSAGEAHARWFGHGSLIASEVVVAHRPATAAVVDDLVGPDATIRVRCVIALGEPDSEVRDGVAHLSAPDHGGLLGVFLEGAWRGELSKLDVASDASASAVVEAMRERIDDDAALQRSAAPADAPGDPGPDPGGDDWRPRPLYCVIWPRRPECQ